MNSSSQTTRKATPAAAPKVRTAAAMGPGTSRRIPSESKRLQQAMDTSGIVWWEWSIPDDHLVPHGGQQCFLGYTPGETRPTADFWLAATHPEDEERVRSTIISVLLGAAQEWSIRHRLRARDGAWRWVQSCGRLVARNREGLPLFAVGTLREVQAVAGSGTGWL